jgi:hypothetical protein
MYTLLIVSAGSTITFSPLLVMRTKSLVRLYCSATKGEILALNKPVPIGRVNSMNGNHPGQLCTTYRIP